jgi:hypothetical protein
VGQNDHLNLLTQCNDKISLLNCLLNRHMYFGAKLSDLEIAKREGERSEIVPVRAIEGVSGSRYIAPFILNLSTRCRPSKHRMRIYLGATVSART